MDDKLALYRTKRRFDETSEPSGDAATGKKSQTQRGNVIRASKAPAKSTKASKVAKANNASNAATAPKASARKSARGAGSGLAFVIQEHDARRLHYDFRLELDGVLKSWAVPKGPSYDPSVKRLAVHVEDHPLDYGTFEGNIPKGNYGAGDVIVWDYGTWSPVGGVAAARDAYRAGKLKFLLSGEKLKGHWALIRSHMPGGKQEQWLLIKERDDQARPQAEFDVVAERPGSVLERKNPPAKAGTARTPRTPQKARDETPDDDSAGGKITGAKRSPMPATLKPQLATLVDTAPAGETWRYEIKFDGYRMLTRVDGDTVTIYSREGREWTAKLAPQAKAVKALGLESAWLDGEAVVLNDDGVPDFQRLQNAFDENRAQHIVLYLFDVPYLNGFDLRDVPLTERRALLRGVLPAEPTGMVRFSETFDAHGADLLASACDMSLEGLIGKQDDAPYVSGRSSSWIKLKCRRRQEFVIGGYTEPTGSRQGFGALLLGVYAPADAAESGNNGKDGRRAKGKKAAADRPLIYAGRVGTGFNDRTLQTIYKTLKAHEVASSPFSGPTGARTAKGVHWIKPDLVAECHFAEWTQDGHVRQAAFIAMREDKSAKGIVREAAAPAKEVKMQTSSENQSRRTTASRTAEAVAGIKISHPERVIDKSSGLRKIDLVRYYEAVGDWILPHLKDRPVSLLRAPDGIGGEVFFQKHSQKLSLPHVTEHAGLDGDHAPLITLDDMAALVGVAQMGAIELHTWNATTSNIERPDRLVLDLDPDPSLPWSRMQEAATLTRDLLHELGLASWCKTSGGKGLHVVVPLGRFSSWDEVKGFSQAVAQHMADTLPQYFSAKMGPQNRKKKIFVDYLRNNRGASTIAAYSARARDGMGVSVPIDWDELSEVKAGDQWTVQTLPERLAALKQDPWHDYAACRQRLTAKIVKRLG